MYSAVARTFSRGPRNIDEQQDTEIPLGTQTGAVDALVDHSPLSYGSHHTDQRIDIDVFTHALVSMLLMGEPQSCKATVHYDAGFNQAARGGHPILDSGG